MNYSLTEEEYNAISNVLETLEFFEDLTSNQSGGQLAIRAASFDSMLTMLITPLQAVVDGVDERLRLDRESGKPASTAAAAAGTGRPYAALAAVTHRALQEAAAPAGRKGKVAAAVAARESELGQCRKAATEARARRAPAQQPRGRSAAS